VLDFARYGFTPRACQPYRARANGKVESVKYVKRNALAGRRFGWWEELNEWLAQWSAGIADQSVHGTTHDRLGDGREAGRNPGDSGKHRDRCCAFADPCHPCGRYRRPDECGQSVGPAYLAPVEAPSPSTALAGYGSNPKMLRALSLPTATIPLATVGTPL
jgi:hypothetical protein